MEVINTEIPEVKIIVPKVFGDSRGYFMETFRSSTFKEKVANVDFIQENESSSSYGVLRGLHFQKPPYSQGKLVRVIKGKVIDVAVDLRTDSPTYGKYVAVELSEENKKQLWVPRGFAHGYIVLSESAIFAYKCDQYYCPDAEDGIMWNDKTINIDWKLPKEDIQTSEKDKEYKAFKSRSFYSSADFIKE
ncbi:MAG: dTDP-4-dehydrorhamnose 3,5-epimerase [Hyphomicrobiales bacterium]